MEKDSLDSLFPPGALDGIINRESSPASPSYQRNIWRVSDLLNKCQDTLNDALHLLWVAGEVSNARRPPSGHLYFTLKDSKSQIQAVMFRSSVERLPFEIKEGSEIICFGRVNIYTTRGDLQLIVETAELSGEGALRIAFEELKKRLSEEGLFSADHKKELPLIPARVFLITSPSGAAVRDFIRTARQRFPGAHIVLVPVQVQGEKAPAEIINGLKIVDKIADESDVAVLTRGGGSLEDLWAFNNEELARAIFSCRIPTVSAVGHEIDFTIADFVADLRAATPTAAAQAIFPATEELMNRVMLLTRSLNSAVGYIIEKKKHLVTILKQQLRDPKTRLIQSKIYCDELNTRLVQSIDSKINRQKERLSIARNDLRSVSPARNIEVYKGKVDALSEKLQLACITLLKQKKAAVVANAAALNAVSPLSVLARGYSLAYKLPDRELIKDSGQVNVGDTVLISPQRGKILCKVMETRQERERKKGSA